MGKGTALGLTVSYAMVEEHGGRMWLTSEPDHGASFYLELPVAGGKLKALAPRELAGGGNAAGEEGTGGPDEMGRVPTGLACRLPGGEGARLRPGL